MKAQARRIVRQCLQRRATALKRIGVAYQLCQLDDPGQWLAADATHGSTAPTKL
jgi:hypothetical protein